jgi:hypothetical protein
MCGVLLISSGKEMQQRFRRVRQILSSYGSASKSFSCGENKNKQIDLHSISVIHHHDVTDNSSGNVTAYNRLYS